MHEEGHCKSHWNIPHKFVQDFHWSISVRICKQCTYANICINLWYSLPEKCFLCDERQGLSWLNFFPQPEGPNENACPVFPGYQSANDYTDQLVHTPTCIQQTNLYTALGVQSYVDFMYSWYPVSMGYMSFSIKISTNLPLLIFPILCYN